MSSRKTRNNSETFFFLSFFSVCLFYEHGGGDPSPLASGVIYPSISIWSPISRLEKKSEKATSCTGSKIARASSTHQQDMKSQREIARETYIKSFKLAGWLGNPTSLSPDHISRRFLNPHFMYDEKKNI